MVVAMFEITRYETKRRMLGTGAITVVLAGLALLFFAIAPETISRGELSAIAKTYPRSVQTAFGIAALGTMEGLLAVELYQFGWVFLLGLYFAYNGGSMIAGDVESDRMEMLLSAPVSRSKVVRERFLSLCITMLIINVVVGIIVYIGITLIGESLSLIDISAVHALSIPYLLVCAAIGLLFSVHSSKQSTSKWASTACLFGLFVLESLFGGTEYEWLAAISPTYYYDPTAILVHNTYDLTGALILFITTVVLVSVGRLRFRQMDIR